MDLPLATAAVATQVEGIAMAVSTEPISGPLAAPREAVGPIARELP